MPFYNFECANAHKQELKMSFGEHDKLEHDSNGPYIECNVRYGDKEHPRCTEKAYQTYGTFGFSVHHH